MIKKFGIAALAVAGATSQAVIIDNFNTPAGFSISSGTAVTVSGPGGIIGGQRDLEGKVLANPLLQFLDISIFGGGVSVVSNGFLTLSEVAFQYDRVDAQPTGVGATLFNGGTGVPLGLDGDRVRLDWIGNDLDVNVVVVTRKLGVITGGGVGLRAGMSGPGFQDIFVNPAALANADSITITFKPNASGDFALRSMQTVPEPATMLALGAGAAVIARRRKARKS